LTTLDLASTFVFAVEGAMTTIAGELDLLGVIILAFATALGGGMIRDVLIGAIPPQAQRDRRYPGCRVDGRGDRVSRASADPRYPAPGHYRPRRGRPNLVRDRGDGKIPPIWHAPLHSRADGRNHRRRSVHDMLLTHVPTVLRVDVYATAALAESAVMVAARRLKMSPVSSAMIGGVVCFGLRLVSVSQHWNLPKATGFQW